MLMTSSRSRVSSKPLSSRPLPATLCMSPQALGDCLPGETSHVFYHRDREAKRAGSEKNYYQMLREDSVFQVTSWSWVRSGLPISATISVFHSRFSVSWVLLVITASPIFFPLKNTVVFVPSRHRFYKHCY